MLTVLRIGQQSEIYPIYYIIQKLATDDDPTWRYISP